MSLDDNRSTKAITIRMHKARIDHLKQLARQLSVKNDEDISYIDLIHIAVSEKYPMPNDGSTGMFIAGS